MNRTRLLQAPGYGGMPEALWERIPPSLAPRPSQPLGGHRPRVAGRRAITAIVKGYDVDELHGHVRRHGDSLQMVPRDAERPRSQTSPGYRARRGPVARTMSWLPCFRRILVRWEKKVAICTAMLHVSCALIACKQAGPAWRDRLEGRL